AGAARAARVRLVRHAVRESVSPLEYLERLLHPWVGFVVMPVFALANAGVTVTLADLRDPVALAVAAGLVLGKPLGVAGASWLAVRAGLARLPDGVGWPAVLGGGVLAGIGFTMALFIAGLALPESAHGAAKVGILLASLAAAVAGTSLLLVVTTRPLPPTRPTPA
ncbi:MAG: Na+/H+ antiporter NhaA, partial [Deltaproteobacteria bacterium]|nr:Na+/H+ antiporter NhaA [Deltaproteobacteria bacterium]